MSYPAPFDNITPPPDGQQLIALERAPLTETPINDLFALPTCCAGCYAERQAELPMSCLLINCHRHTPAELRFTEVTALVELSEGTVTLEDLAGGVEIHLQARSIEQLAGAEWLRRRGLVMDDPTTDDVRECRFIPTSLCRTCAAASISQEATAQ